MNAQPFPYTHLSLNEYAKILGISPVHFAGASGTNFWPTSGACEDVWPRHVWQTTQDVVSHEEIVNAIHMAENDIARVQGFAVAPEWDEQYVLNYPKHHNPLIFNNAGMNVRGQMKSVNVGKARIISPGRRASVAVDAASTVTYSDPDLDGWNELATVTAATALTDTQEIHVFQANTLGNPAWEIRPLKSVAISGGIVTITMDSWVLIDPDLYGAYPTTGDITPIDVEAPASFVTTVDIYRVYNDVSQSSVEFLWERQSSYAGIITVCTSCGGAGCSQCTLIEQSGCFTVLDGNRGVVTPFPATYDASTELWTQACWTEGRDADQVRLYFRSGEYGQEYLQGWSSDPLDREMARAIAWLATARIERTPCSCANVDSVFRELRKDLAASSRNQFNVRFSTQDIFKSPFGFRAGEVRAWMHVHSLNRGTEFGGSLL